MFENIIEQPAVLRLKDDIAQGNLAQSMLFFGNPETAKSTTALELARVLSCEKEGPLQAEWKCACPSCERHRYLLHDDLLVLGKRNFLSEISAFHSIFLKNPCMSSKLLLYRSLRKLQIRFSPVIAGDDPKISKIKALIQSFNEKMDDFFSLNSDQSTAMEKLCKSIMKDAEELEEEGISANIPISQIRSASYWCRLAPSGKQKVLVIENADNMGDSARNCMLKLLEEPPQGVSIILISQRRESIIPTILSRLRPYRFLARSKDAEKEVLRRVFQVQELHGDTEESAERAMTANGSLISAYLDSFLPSSSGKLYPLAKWFTEQDYTDNNPNSAGIAQTVKALLAKSNNFENDSLPVFLKLCLEITAKEARKAKDPRYIKYFDLYKKHINEAVTAVDVYNQSAPLALEALLYKLKTKMDISHA